MTKLYKIKNHEVFDEPMVNMPAGKVKRINKPKEIISATATRCHVKLNFNDNTSRRFVI